MPLYNYLCKTHGEFDAWRPMSESSSPAPCPACKRRARRAVSAPRLALMDGGARKAHTINERSANEPRVVRRGEPGDAAVGGHNPAEGRRPGHAHGKHGHRHGPSRPWMVGH